MILRASRSGQGLGLVLDVIPEAAAYGGASELVEGLRLDLPDALARHAEHVAHFLEGPGPPVQEPESQLHDPLLPVGQVVEGVFQLLAQQLVGYRIHRYHGARVGDEVGERAVLFLADGRLQRHRDLADLEYRPDFVWGDVHLDRQLIRRRLRALLLQHAQLDLRELVHVLDHMDRDPDSPRLVGYRPRHRLADPPRGVGTELETSGVVILLHPADQAKVAFLNEVEEEHAPSHVALRDADDTAEVGSGALVFGLEAVLLQRLESFHLVLVHVAVLLQRGRRVTAALDPARQRDLLHRRQQGYLADLFEVHADRVVQRAAVRLFARRADLMPDSARRLMVAWFDKFVFRFVRYLDPGFREEDKDVVHLVGRKLDAFEAFDDIACGKEALFFSCGGKLVDLVEVRASQRF